MDKWLTVLLLRADNVTLEKIAEMTGYSRSQVSNILKLYAESGLEGITSNHYPGNRRYLTIEEESAILEQFRQRAEAGQIIEVKEIRKVYEAAVGHEVSYSQIYNVLHRHNWRKVMPRRKHPKKATPEAIEQIWKEIRKRGFRNEAFHTLEKVVDRLCDTVMELTNEVISSITCRQWIRKCFA